MKIRLPIFLIIILFSFLVSCKYLHIKPRYLRENVPVERRVKNLVRKMTLEEKIRQMDMFRGEELTTNRLWDGKKIKKIIGKTGIGSVHDLYPEDVEMVNEMQRYAIGHSRLHIPVLFIEEALHGYLGKGSTVFPQAISLASMWDTAVVRQIGRAVAEETRCHGVDMVLAPVLGLARDPRWGRTEETYGEDPWLAAQTGLAMVKGLQGDTLFSSRSVVAEPKHFGVHSIPEAGSNTAPVSIGEREARSSFLKVFETAFRQGRAMGVMAAYHEIDGIPCVSNKWLLTDLLRKEWGFKGFVLCDLGAIGMQQNTHHTAATPEEAISQAVGAGTDMQFYDYDHDTFRKSILQAVKDGSLSIQAVNRAVSSILRVKFLLGLFDHPYTDTSLVRKRFATKEHRQLALKAAREAIILLKNQNHTLPLSTDIKTLAVIGPMANRQAMGDYTAHTRGITVLEGIRNKYGKKITILHAVGLLPKKVFTVVPNEFLIPEVKVPGKKGLTGRYFSNDSLSGKPGFTRTDTMMAANWITGSPDKNIPVDHFSARWTGYLVPAISGRYELGIITDDKGRLFLNNKLVIDNWDPYDVNVMKTREVNLVAGYKYPVRIDFAEEEGFAGIRFMWRMVESGDKPQSHYIHKAAEAASMSDAAVVVLGETRDMVGEGKDKASLAPDPDQLKLLQEVVATGKPVVAVFLNGRPLSINWAAAHVPAILEGWFPGQEGGIAIAEVLFGEVNPSGKLPVTIPRSVGQLPFYYDHKPSSGHRYVDMPGTPLYPFGYGLSYTTFRLDSLTVDPEKKTGEEVYVSVKITNTGDRAGTQVVQLYIRDETASVTTPVKQLAGFRRVKLQPGESQNLHFTLTKENLGLWNREMHYTVEPGKFRVMVGFHSEEGMTKEFTLK